VSECQGTAARILIS